MKKSWKVKDIVAILASLLFVGALIIFSYLILPVSHDNVWKEIEIPEGSSFSKVVTILSDEGIIKNRFAFHVLGRVTKTDRSMKAGFYNLNSSMSPLEIHDRLRKGMIVEYSIMIPEGSGMSSIRRKLADVELVDDDSWQLATDSAFLESLNIRSPSLEGYLYPDTYKFAKGADPRHIFSIMVQRMRDQFDETLMARARELEMTENEVLTLASIIEKEAIYDSERPLISAVYHNRLKKGMKLQADPTVLYGVKKRWKRIRYRDLRRVTPYNTYQINGLPPGPIASPGIQSIKAALYPADTDYLFFVAMNNGKHFFSTTGEEHAEAVDLYQRNGYNKARNGKSKIN